MSLLPEPCKKHTILTLFFKISDTFLQKNEKILQNFAPFRTKNTHLCNVSISP